MPLPEGYLPREGDILVIHVRKFSIPLKDVERLHCRHWNVGAEIQRKATDPLDRRPGEVLAVDGDMVWVKFSDGKERFMTLHANQIEPRQSYLAKVREQYDTPEPPPSPVAAAVAAGRAPTLEEVAATITEEKPDVQF